MAPRLAEAQALDAESDQIARERYNAGREAYGRGDFSTAASNFERAYALSRRPMLLYHIGNAYNNLHRWEQARSSYRRYLDAVPQASDRAEVEARLRIIETEIANAATPHTQVVVVERPVERVEPARPWRTAFWVGVGLTTVATAGTVAVGLLADRQYRNLLDSCGQSASGCDAAAIDDMRLREGIINGGIVASAVFAVGTAAAFVIDLNRRPPAPTGEVQVPTAGPTSASFVPLQGGGLVTLGGRL
ncbi:MAG: tetratricopeptide repeat protein [Myxococcales bacterium]|nr:tetratricopeptide repeat protein [Myxococcales bacterium]